MPTIPPHKRKPAVRPVLESRSLGLLHHHGDSHAIGTADLVAATVLLPSRAVYTWRFGPFWINVWMDGLAEGLRCFGAAADAADDHARTVTDLKKLPARTQTKLCGATAVMWLGTEQCEAECTLAAGHGPPDKHQDEVLGVWSEHQYPTETRKENDESDH